MKILLIEPFFTGSHQSWCEGFQRHSQHDIKIISLEGRHWKWRMHGGAITISEMLENETGDLIVVSDMIDLGLLTALLPNQLKSIPVYLYMHENQLTYPWSPDDADVDLKRDRHYAFMNYTSALCADKIFFNSAYHLKSFLSALPDFLKVFPDHNNLESVKVIEKKSSILYLGMDLERFDVYKNEKENEFPLILWNHRWEYDKNPEEFFETLIELVNEGYDFQLAVLGESYKSSPEVFGNAREVLKEKIVHWGWVESFEEYAKWLWRADILPVTSNQDFFGGSVVEAMYCNTYPLLPNRLAYPEHVEKSLLYEPGEFKSRLSELLTSLETFDGSYLLRYHWNEMISGYDYAM